MATVSGVDYPFTEGASSPRAAGRKVLRLATRLATALARPATVSEPRAAPRRHAHPRAAPRRPPSAPGELKIKRYRFPHLSSVLRVSLIEGDNEFEMCPTRVLTLFNASDFFLFFFCGFESVSWHSVQCINK